MYYQNEIMAKEKTEKNPKGAGPNERPDNEKCRTFYCRPRNIVLDTLLEGATALERAQNQFNLKREIEAFLEKKYEEEMLRRLNEKMGV